MIIKMKKLIITILTIFISCISYAQLNIVYQNNDKPKDCISMMQNNAHLYKYSWGYLFSTPTSNRFDDNIDIFLGEDENTAIKTLNDLLKLIDEKVYSVRISQDDPFEDISISCESFLGEKCLLIFSDNRAGRASTNKLQIKGMIRYLNKELSKQ